MAGCDNNCDAVAGLHEAAANLIQYSKLIESWLYGAQDQTVDVGGVTTPTLLNLINSIRQFVGVWPDGQTIKFCPDKKIYVPLKEGGGISSDNDGLFADVARPDGVTTNLNEDGLLSALGGNLLMNDEIWITESGTFTAPVTGWYDVLCIGGGTGGYIYDSGNLKTAVGGISGRYKSALIRLSVGDEVSVSIGAAGVGGVSTALMNGGDTTFGSLSTVDAPSLLGTNRTTLAANGAVSPESRGGGFGAGVLSPQGVSASFYGGGGSTYFDITTQTKYQGNGAPGAIRLRFWNPAKASGPAPEPTLP